MESTFIAEGKVKDEEGNEYTQGKYKTYRKPYIIIDSLEQLMNLLKDLGVSLIIDDGRIIIYDDYVE